MGGSRAGPGVPPSIFGVGEGCAYFGLHRAVYIFHPNDDLGLRKLRHLDEVTCDISKWETFEQADPFALRQRVDATPERVRSEAEKVSRLSLLYPNVTGAFHDDMLGLIRREKYTSEQYGEVYRAVHGANPALQLWVWPAADSG